MKTIRFSYVLPDPGSYEDWGEFDGDLAVMRRHGYDAVELQIADPARLDEARLRRSLEEVGYPLCAFQTGGSYATQGNCLCTRDEGVRRRTIDLMLRFVDLAARWRSTIVFGSLQGRLGDEPDRDAGAARIADALMEIGREATRRGATIAFEPVNRFEVGFHNTIAEAAGLVRRLDLAGLRLMVDTYHMNIEERDMVAPLATVADLLAHVHLSETNRDVLGTGHWDTAALLRELARLDYGGCCSVGVYGSRTPRRQCIQLCMDVLREVPAD
jgi:sugar phosphate isomerase/epimerase